MGQVGCIWGQSASVNNLKILLHAVFLPRNCAYYLAYKLEKRWGDVSLMIPPIIIGIFEGPLFLALTMGLNVIFFDNYFSNYFSIMSAFSIFGWLWGGLLYVVELISFRVLQWDRKIIREMRKSEIEGMNRIRIYGISYAFMAFMSGAILVNYLHDRYITL